MFSKGYGFGNSSGGGGGLIQTLSNGLTLVGTDGQLGGTLTGSTLINGNNNALSFINNNSVNIASNLAGFVNINSDPNSGSTLIGGGGLLTSISGGIGGISLNSNIGGIVLNTPNQGATYVSSPTNLTPTTIPSYQNVTDAIASSNTTASNGLSKVGSAIELGGSLSKDTTINLNSNNFTLTEAGTGSVINLLSGNTTFIGSKSYTQIYGVNVDILAQGSFSSDIQLQVTNGGYSNTISQFRNSLQISGINPSVVTMWDLYFQENLSRLFFENDFTLKSETNTLDFISELDLGITSNNGTVNINGDVIDLLTNVGGSISITSEVVSISVTTAGNGATYVSLPTILNDLTIPSYKNVTDAIASSNQTLSKTFTLESPTASDNITIFRTDVAITIQEVIAVSTGTTPSTTYKIVRDLLRNAIGTDMTTSSATTSITGGDTATISGGGSVPANSWIWFETSAVAGTNVILSIDIRYTED